MTRPVALTIAGSDCSAGAGMQADLKTFSCLGIHGLTAVTCVVSETPLTVSKVHPVPPVILQDQIQLLLESYPVGAIKTGMLCSKAHIVAVAELLANCDIPLIVDPVMVASTGDPLLAEDVLEAISDRLLPLASIITPNLPEASLILKNPVVGEEDQEVAAHALSERFRCACYLKGGHLQSNIEHRDLLVDKGALESFTAPHLDLPQSHGTGCTFAAALTAGMAKGLTIFEACSEAHHFTHEALKHSFEWNPPLVPKRILHLDQTKSR